MRSSILNKLKQVRKGFDAFRGPAVSPSIFPRTENLHRNANNHESDQQSELQFALLELRELILEDTSLEVSAGQSALSSEIPLLTELGEAWSPPETGA
jgi:hypothetical protein